MRIRLLVVVLAVAAGGAAAAVAWTGRAQESASPTHSQPSGPRQGAPPLELDPLVRDRELDASLRAAERLYDDGNRSGARAAFDEILAEHPDSVEAAVGAAIASWPDGTTPRLEELAAREPARGLVQLHLGLAYLWGRRDGDAQDAWREALRVEPDSSSAIRAESLLHPEMAPARPFYVPGASFPAELAGLLPLEQLEALEERAAGSGSVTDRLLYGSGLQRAGRVVSAVEAFDRAVELSPDDPEALTAAALARFAKDDPSAAFSRLGPLADRFPQSAVVRFHLGLALLWLRSAEEARRQLGLAVASEPDTVWADQARRLLAELDREGTGG